MRIDYSEPKKSCSTPQPSQSRPRKESSGFGLMSVVLSSLLCLGVGFGSGWMLSQRSAKKGFRDATAQQSFESAPQRAKVEPVAQKPTPPPPAQPPQVGAAAPQAAAASPTGGTPAAGEQPLSFYKTLPSGQKSNVMGSGINPKNDKPASQPLQAAMPANMTRPAAPPEESAPKQAAPSIPAKPAAHQDANGFTVQVASYSLRSEAETLRGTLTAKGYNVAIVESHLGDKGTWYRVRVGRHLDPDAAKDLAKKLGKNALSIPDKE